jgi:hypothetical protein
VRECRQPRRCRIPNVVGRHEVESSRRFLGKFLGVASARKVFFGGCDESVGVRQIVCVRERERRREDRVEVTGIANFGTASAGRRRDGCTRWRPKASGGTTWVREPRQGDCGTERQLDERT